MIDAIVHLDSSDATDPWNCSTSPAQAMLWCDPVSLRATCADLAGMKREWADPLESLRWMQRTATRPGNSNSRWIGYFSYEFGRLLEPIASRHAVHSTDWPLFIFTRHECRPPSVTSSPAGLDRSRRAVRSNFTRAEYELAVSRAIEYIAAGDIFQVNLSQRFTAETHETPAVIYSRLQNSTPARYAALLDYGDRALISNSPELFLKVEPMPDGRRKVTTRPIKGTRPLLPGMDQELRNSVKDMAELNMIVDLERNDLGRVCEIGSIRVREPRRIEAHPTVYHGVATIEGILRSDVDLVDLLRATFPGGSITGAPKIRAMQIIDELEPHPRGPYCGAIGYLAADGTMQFNIAIRTIAGKGGQLSFSAGGGIVADSDPAAEYEETLVKARAMLAALGCSIDDLH